MGVTERAQEARQKVNMRHAEVNAKIAYSSQHQVATELHSSRTPVATELSRKGKHPKPLSFAQKCCLAKMWECCYPVDDVHAVATELHSSKSKGKQSSTRPRPA